MVHQRAARMARLLRQAELEKQHLILRAGQGRDLALGQHDCELLQTEVS